MSEPKGKLRGTNTKIDDLMKKLIFRGINACIPYLFLFFTGRTNIQSSKRGHPQNPVLLQYPGLVQNLVVGHGTSQGPNYGTFLGCLQDIGQTCFLNSNQKQNKLTLTGYSRFYNES